MQEKKFLRSEIFIADPAELSSQHLATVFRVFLTNGERYGPPKVTLALSVVAARHLGNAPLVRQLRSRSGRRLPADHSGVHQPLPEGEPQLFPASDGEISVVSWGHCLSGSSRIHGLHVHLAISDFDVRKRFLHLDSTSGMGRRSY